MSEICFVHMPFTRLAHPSMAMSVLAGECRAQQLDVDVIYANLRLAKLMSLEKYTAFMEQAQIFSLLGEAVFCAYAGFPAASGDNGLEKFLNYCLAELAKQKLPERVLDTAVSLSYELAAQLDTFLDELSDEIIAKGIRIVGCDITYAQRNASLALLKRIKEKKPDIITMLGGNSCTGSSGQMLAKYAAQVDYVFSGEADDIIVPVLRYLLRGEAPEAINTKYPSVLIANSPLHSHGRESLETCSIPDFTDYFTELQTLGLNNNISPCLLIEGSRGCWWGQHQRCTFCGIHTSRPTLCYRQKSPQKIADELRAQAQKYGIHAFVFTDCILSMQHVNGLPQVLTEADNFHCFAEVKSNLSAVQLAELRRVGFIMLQPGIESLQDELLTLMNKGNRALKHIEFMKHCQTYGISIIWNLLFRLPQENVAAYEEIAALLPWLTHLQAPNYFAQILFPRNCTYVQEEERYQLHFEPLEIYRHIGTYGEEFIAGTAEYFVETTGALTPSPAMEQATTEIAKIVTYWKSNFCRTTRLQAVPDKDGDIDIFDFRPHAKHSLHHLKGVKKDIFLAMENVIKIQVLRQQFAELTEAEFETVLHELIAEHLALSVGGEVLNLATHPSQWKKVDEPLLPIGQITLGGDRL